MKRLIECVPNFSEGRDAAKVDALVAAMQSVAGVYVLDREMDADHNRCVITLAGEPDAVLLDINLPDGSGLDLLRKLKHLRPQVPLTRPMQKLQSQIDYPKVRPRKGSHHWPPL